MSAQSEKARYVVGFAFDASCASVLLLRKTRPQWQLGKLNGFGGKIEAGESPDAAMAREAEEEAGMRADWTLFAHLSGEGWEMWCYRADVVDVSSWSGLSNDVGEMFEYHPVADVTAARVETIPNLAWLVPMAIGHSAHDWPYMIRERAARPTHTEEPREP